MTSDTAMSMDIGRGSIGNPAPIAPRFALAPRLTIAKTLLGREGEPLLVIDDVMADPQHLVDEAARAKFAPAFGLAGGYPGLRAPAPLDYVEAVARTLFPQIVAAFALPPVRLARAECNFSLVTQRPETLVASQREPHVDTADPLQFAILHYLCGPEHGGTAFYRHGATGFETLTEDRLAPYRTARASEPPPPAGYPARESNAFEQIGGIDAAFDRIAIYRSRLLHSGLIPDPTRLSNDPRTGRLTANIFLTLRPR